MKGLGWLPAARNSLDGLRHALRHERSVRQEGFVFLVAVPAAVFIAQDARHAVLLLGSLLLVVAVELLNNAIEAVCDRLTRERDPAIKIAKDSGSAAVSVSIAIALAAWVEAFWSFLR